MVFNSASFFIFFAAVWTACFLLDHKRQNRLLLLASYFFYGFWDWRFLSLIWTSTILDYCCARKIESLESRAPSRKIFLALSIAGNLGILCFFKYFNFFSDSLTRFWTLFGWKTSPVFLEIILPLGISFYTFQTMSYTIDVYRKEIKPVRNFFDFALFVSFFPQLVAGPIERAKNLLPQITKPREMNWDLLSSGCFLLFWGLFLKVGIADNLAAIVDPVFAPKAFYNGADVLVGTYAFAFQILCDFAGYSIMAKGIARCLGFHLMDNFRQPYFTSNPKDFWSEWHISLSTWLRDYLYIPLGGNRGGSLKTYRNLTITMLLGGLWHGAAWTFILWGAYQGFLLSAHRFITEKMQNRPTRKGSSFRLPHPVKVFLFFHLVCAGWIMFRAQSLPQVFEMLYAVFFNFNPAGSPTFLFQLSQVLFFIFPLLLVQYLQRRAGDLMVPLQWPWVTRGAFYFTIFFLTVTIGVGGGQEFIYFQF